MPQFVQQISGQSYALIEPRLGWARGKVSLLDGACGRLERVVTPVIGSADRCIDGSVEAITARATAVRTLVSKRAAPVRAKFVEAQSALVTSSLGLLDSSEKLIDRVLPLPTQPWQEPLQEEEAVERVRHEARLVYRVARLPFAVPMRITMIVYVKANGAVDSMTLSARHAAGLAVEKQKQLAQNVIDRARPLTDKIADISSLSLKTVQKNSMVRRVTVQVNNVVIRLHVVEAKNWSVKTASDLKMGSQNLVLAVLRRACDTTAHIIGQPRAKALFGKWQSPVESSESKSESRCEQEASFEEVPGRRSKDHEVVLEEALIPPAKKDDEPAASKRNDEEALAACEVKEHQQKAFEPVLSETIKVEEARDTFEDVTPKNCSSLNSAAKEKVDLTSTAQGVAVEHAGAAPERSPPTSTEEQAGLAVDGTAVAPRQELDSAVCEKLPGSTQTSAEEPAGFASTVHGEVSAAAAGGLTGTPCEELPDRSGALKEISGGDVFRPAANAQTESLNSKSKRKSRSRGRTAHGVS